MSATGKSLMTWFKGISEGWKLFIGMVTIVTTISTVAIKIDRWSNKSTSESARIDRWINYDSLEHIESIKFREAIQLQLNGITNNVRSIRDSVRSTNKNIRQLSVVNYKMQRYMINNVATKDGVLEIQNIFNYNEKKNYGPDGFRTPSDTTRYYKLFGILK